MAGVCHTDYLTRAHQASPDVTRLRFHFWKDQSCNYGKSHYGDVQFNSNFTGGVCFVFKKLHYFIIAKGPFKSFAISCIFIYLRWLKSGGKTFAERLLNHLLDMWWLVLPQVIYIHSSSVNQASEVVLRPAHLSNSLPFERSVCDL